jgi:hypothetical protein
MASLGLALLALLCFGAIWLIRLIGWVTSRTTSGGLTWLLAPPMVIATLLLWSTDVPLWARFELARGDFDAYVSDLDPQGGFSDWVRIDPPSDLGTYEIRAAWQVGENVIIFESTGALLDDAGFAYLPHGPDDRLENGSFEAPSFHSLGGGWYSWTASW